MFKSLNEKFSFKKNMSESEFLALLPKGIEGKGIYYKNFAWRALVSGHSFVVERNVGSPQKPVLIQVARGEVQGEGNACIVTGEIQAGKLSWFNAAAGIILIFVCVSYALGLSMNGFKASIWMMFIPGGVVAFFNYWLAPRKALLEFLKK